MKREFADQFNQEVDGYRKALLYYARQCDWEAFKARAGRLFDYVESVEFQELERRFFKTFNLVLAALVLAVIALCGVDFNAHQELLSLKNAFVLAAIGASSFELYFFFDYRMYCDIKTFCYKKRRENFIRNMEQDFRSFAFPPERQAA